MSLAATIVWEVRTTGADTNGGGYKTGASGMDFTQQNTPQYALTGLTTAAGNAILLSASAAADMVGNVIQITGGTNFIVGFYEILSVVVGVSITVDRNCTSAAGAAGVGNIGGALASPGMAAVSAITPGMKIYVKAGTYTITTSTPGAAGPVVLSAGVFMEGYQTTKGDLGTPPVISAGSVGSVTICKSAGTFGVPVQGFLNVNVDGNSQSSVVGFQDTSQFEKLYALCKAINCTTGFSLEGTGWNHVIACMTDGCTTGFNFAGSPGMAAFCTAKSGTTGFTSSTTALTLTHCLAYSQSGQGFTNTYAVDMVNCIANGCGGDGFSTTNLEISGYTNCVSTNNTGYGFNLFGAAQNVISCGGYNNTAGLFSVTPTRHVMPLATITGDPWTNAAGGDFKPNATAGAGAVVRAASINVAGQTGYLDAGAVQHQDSGGGGSGGMHLVGSGGLVS